MSSFLWPAETTELLHLFVNARWKHAAPVLHTWYAPDVLRTQFESDLAEEVGRVSDPAFAAAFRSHAPMEGVTRDEAYLNRVLEVPHLGAALVGLRFRALDLARPFVTVVAHSEPLPGVKELHDAVAFLRAQFAEFAPKHVQFFVPAGRELDETHFPPGSHWDVHVIAGRLNDLRKRPWPEHADRVTLDVPADLSFYPRYVAAYETLYAAHAEHREFARIEELDDLARYLQDGTLFEVRVDGAWAGVVAVTPAAEQGLSGFVVTEMFLEGAHRGRGFGPAVGRRLVERLQGEAGDVLYGTVHHGNVTARRSAYAAGREDVGAFFWVGPSCGRRE